MKIFEITTSVKTREAKVFIVDYDRLKPDSWPRLTPIDEYIPAFTNRKHSSCVDRILALKYLTAGLGAPQVAKRLGCSAPTIRAIRANARAGRT